ncbi:MAG: 4Fe-4S dicluster domain-containing protein [Bacteroidota bacterium]
MQQIKYESELDKTFGETISRKAYGEKLFGCIQCGTCSATCPLSTYMDFTPRKIIAMVRAGFKDEVLTNRTIWLCASCYSCSVECPKGIKITEVMYTLKREAIMHGIYPKRFNIPILARVFFQQVRKHGRTNEIYLMMKYFFATNPLLAISQVPLAIKMFLKGRLSLLQDKITQKAQLTKILNTIESNKEDIVL